jgi:EAL domain-containing protein (putative c-di-GMP-specific phosphodiesterase class I)/two-component sensor histidine kinase
MGIRHTGTIEDLVWDWDEDGRPAENAGTAGELARALTEGQIVVHLQPMVDLRTGQLFGFESFVRWAHPERGVAGPDKIVPLAEQSGLIGAVGTAVLKAACRALADWSRQRPDQSLTVSVNISAQQLADPALAVDVSEAIAAAGIPPGRLCLEVTESAVMDATVAAQALRRLKAIGVAIAIDDFGTGYSSLSRLKRFPVDFLKIDASFVAGLGRDPEDEAIVTAVIGLAKSLGVQVIAEGIETRAQLAFLTRQGCNLGQGFLWSRPLSELDAAAFAARRQLCQHVPAPVGASGRTAVDGGARDAAPVRADTDAMAILVHELATPLAVIHGYAEILNELPPGERHTMLQQALDAMLRQTQTMTSIVSSIEDMRAIEEGRLVLDRQTVDLVALAAELRRDLSVAGATNAIEVVAVEPVSAFVDGARCRQMLTNLISNALSWSPPGRPVEVNLCGGPAGFVSLTVVDHGPGVPDGRSGELFRRFSRLDRSRKGTGLGLYIARALARAHGGDLRYRRAPTGGAEFVVELPTAEPADA